MYFLMHSLRKKFKCSAKDANVHSSKIHNRQKLETPKMPPRVEWVKKNYGVFIQWVIQWNNTQERQRNELLSHATTYRSVRSHI